MRAVLSQAIEGRNQTVPFVNKLMTYHSMARRIHKNKINIVSQSIN